MSTALKDPVPVSKQYTPHRFTVQEYYQMAAAGGVFDSSNKVELIEGEVVDMVPIGSKHADWVDRLSRFFMRLMPDEIIVRIQNPVRLSDFSEPEPDLALLTPRDKSYAEAHPSAGDVMLLIEVAESSLDYDSSYKASLYARYGISEYWIIDVEGNQLIILRDPSEDGYRATYRPKLDEVVSLQLLDDIRIDLAMLF